jgi:uncharacterized protein (DUF1501 family)
MRTTRRALGLFGVSFGLGSVRLGSVDVAFAAEARADETPAQETPAVVVLWLNGGPSHIDTFDPKPGAAGGGPFRAIPTRLSGLSLSEHLPGLAEVADQLAFVRGMSTTEGDHRRAQYLLHAGYIPNATVEHPGLGAWLSHELGAPPSGLPAAISVGGPSLGAGFLGMEYAPFVLKKAGEPPPNVAYAGDVDATRFDGRRALLERLETRFFDATHDPNVQGRRAIADKAVRLMRAPALRAFDLSEETAETRRAYGDSDFGRGCLLARRLVASGVRYVEVVLDGWDTHQDNFGRVQKLLAAFDPAMSQLVRDLGARGLYRRTVVVAMGEFGRTPRINATDGRDHYPGAWSVVLGGSRLRRGVVHGVTDDAGATVVRDPMTVADLFATIATAVGVDPSRTMVAPTGRPIALTNAGRPVAALLG